MPASALFRAPKGILGGARGRQAMMTASLLEAAPGIGAKGATFQFALTPDDVSIQEEIDTFLAGFSPQGFRADEACPLVLVDQDTDQFRIFTQNNTFRQANVLASLQSDIEEVDPETVLSEYRVVERALGAFIPRVTEGQAAPLYDVRLAAARRIQMALSLDREIRIFGTGGLLSTAGNWNANNVETIAGGSEWTVTTVDPILDIQQRILASAQPVTGIWFNEEVGFTFLRNPNVRDHMRQMLGDDRPQAQAVDAAGARNQQIQDFQIPGLPPFHIVPQKVLNETTSLLEPILTDSVVLTCQPAGGVPVTGEEIMTAVSWRRRGPSGNGFTTREFEAEARGLEGGTMMVSGHAEEEQFISNVCGGLIVNVLP